MQPIVLVIGTCDTKGEELAYAAACLGAVGVIAEIVDVGTAAPGSSAARAVAAAHPDGVEAVFGHQDRGLAVTAMAIALERHLSKRGPFAGVLGFGGSGNTAIVTTAMRSLPIGLPKLMVSTIASGDVAPHVGASDITMMYSVTDIAGLNRISRVIIGNAAHAMAGMVLHAAALAPAAASGRRSVGFTMFGVTTAAVTAIRERLPEIDPFVFHATGTGGRSMEQLIDSRLIDAAIDLTTTEVADFIVGGIMPCGPDRFGAIARTRIPYIGSVGALDMVNFGACETVPQRFAGRLFHVHNANVTLMRTTPDENVEIGQFIAERLALCDGPVRFLLPLGGVSAIDVPGHPFHDPVADAALFDSLRRHWRTGPDRQLIESPFAINDPGFAESVAEQFRTLAP